MGDIEGSFNYPKELKILRQCQNEIEVLEGLMGQLSAQMTFLQDARTCLSVGTGYGDFDIPFIKTCLPNLKKLIVIEKDHNCAEELEENLNLAFGNKIDVEIHETTIEKFVESSDKTLHKELDIVLALHSMYLLVPSDRMRFFKHCFNLWLKPDTGSLVIVNCARDSPLARLSKQLKLKPDLLMEDMEEEISSMGRMAVQKVQYKFKIDVRNHKETLYKFFMLSSYIQVTKEEFLKAFDVVCNGGIFEQQSKLHEWYCLRPNKLKQSFEHL